MRLAALICLLAACDALTGGGDDTGVGTTWTATAHPCVGNRTDTLWLDDDQTAWVGCGTTTLGYGVFRTTDGGASWEAPATSPAGFFDAFRVSSVHRSADGVLYVAGIGGDDRVVAVDTSASPMTVTPVFQAMGQTWNGFHVGTFRRNSAGFAVAESLTGADAAYRDGDGGTWTDGYGWWTSGTSFQILDMVMHDDGFYAAGSTIAQPPHVFLPVDSPTGFQLQPVQLSTAFSGELWGIDVDAGGIVAGGVNQDDDVGVVFTGPVNGTDPGDWTMLDVSTIHGGTSPTWIRGVCRNGQRIVAVGELSMVSDGLVFLSTDGGGTWTEITPSGAPSLHRCVLRDNGTLYVAGADGYFAARR